MPKYDKIVFSTYISDITIGMIRTEYKRNL